MKRNPQLGGVRQCVPNVIKLCHRRIIAQHPLRDESAWSMLENHVLLLSDPSPKGMLRDDPTDTNP
ncbi:MAG: hypothetical protein ABIG63_12290 [Chloroflexota bacterium]